MYSIRTLLRYRKILAICLLSIFILVLILNGRNDDNIGRIPEVNESEEHLVKRLAILVPFRDRFDELLVFVPHISDFLRAQRIFNFRIYILNQSARYRFNRGSLINVGYMIASNTSDYIAIHDVDLIPLNQNLSYAYPKYGPYHLASPDYHPQYHFPKYFGGIVIINNQQFEQANGMSNKYYGWGLEDDEFFLRIRGLGLPVFRPSNLATNITNTFMHIHYKNRKRDMYKSEEQKEVSRRVDRKSGLSDLKFTIVGRHILNIDHHSKCEVLNIELICDRKHTPWCVRQKEVVSTQTKAPQ